MSMISTKQRPAGMQTGVGVPWSTVVPLAVVMAYADGFWMTSLRGAFGAIGRTQHPFASWWRESTSVLPIFALAVLGALMLGLRWFGPLLKRTTVFATGLMVVAAGTVVGIAEIAVSSAYDYHLESDQLKLMASLHSSCAGSCVAREQHATLAVQFHAVFFASQALLITNLVLVVWLVAMHGGRLKVSAIRRRPYAPNQPVSTSRSRVEDIRLLLIAGLLASAAIRVAGVPHQLAKSAIGGLPLLLLSAAEITVAAILIAYPQRRALHAAALISAVPLLLWLATRTIGLPIGPTAGVHRDSIALPDILTSTLELGTLLAALVLLRAVARLQQRPPISAHLRGLVLLAMVAASLLALTGTGSTWVDNTPSSSGQHTAGSHHSASAGVTWRGSV